MTFIDRNLLPLEAAYHKHVYNPLKAKYRTKMRDCPPKAIEKQFELLFVEDQSWYDLLLAVGFDAGETLPFTTNNFSLPTTSPTDRAATELIGHSSKLIVTIGPKLVTTEASRVAKFEKKQATEAKRAADDMKKKLDEQQEQQKKRDLAANKEKERLESEHQKLMLEASVAANKEKEESETRKRRFEGFKTLVQTLEGASTANPDDLAKLTEFSEDPYFASLLTDADRPASSGSQSTSLADAINCIRSAAIVNELTPSPGPSGFRHPGSSKAKSPFESKSAATSEFIDLTHSDDEYEIGDRLVMQKQLGQFPWQTYGLTPDIIAPALHAIKAVEVEDKALFSKEVNVKKFKRLNNPDDDEYR
jgi:hypothetical protein